MKKLDEKEFEELARSLGWADPQWKVLPSGIHYLDSNVSPVAAFIAGARVQFARSCKELSSLEAELVELRKFKESIVLIAANSALYQIKA